jgi:RNA polymerase sigma-70 factor (ECF subfamily)
MQRLPRDQFAALVAEHHAAVHRSAARWLDAAEAADVTQDVFVRLLEGKLRLQAAHSVRATLCWLATRLAANRRRSRSRRNRHEENTMDAADDRTRSEDPARLAADADLLRAVHQELDTLPSELRLPVQLHCQDELTLAAIGTALKVPMSTVHDRVQQGLQRLRRSLAGRGLALGVAGVPDLVARLPIGAPGGLRERLLALPELGSTTALGLGARFALGIAAAATTVAVAAFAWWPERRQVPVVDRTASVTAPAASAADLPPAGALAALDRTAIEAQDPPAVALGGSIRNWTSSVFHGTVVDAAAWPVAHATVQAVAAGGMKDFDLGATRTDEHGAFWFELGPHTLYPAAIRLRVVEGGRLLLESPELPLPRAADADALALVLPAAVGTAQQQYDLTVTVVDRDGAPVPGVPVQVLGAGTPPPLPGRTPAEAEQVTGGDGTAQLHGRSLGAKWLFVDGREVGLTSVFRPLTLPRAGAHYDRVTLSPGGRLEVHVRAVEGTLLPWANVALVDEATGLPFVGELGADGVVVFAGLGAGAHRLTLSSDQEFSLVDRGGLFADREPVEVRVKRRDDLRDIGDHTAELHGELVDAATGEVVEWGAFAVDVRPLRAGASSLPSDRLVPRGAAQQMDGGGRFTAFHEVGLGAGRQALLTDVPGYAPAVLEVELRAGEMRTGVRLPLRRGAEVRGRVVDAQGQPVQYARVFPLGIGELADRCLTGWRSLGAERHAPEPSVPCTVAYTDARGEFVLARVPPDVELRLVAHQREHGCGVGTPRVLRAGERVDGLQLQLERR